MYILLSLAVKKLCHQQQARTKIRIKWWLLYSAISPPKQTQSAGVYIQMYRSCPCRGSNPDRRHADPLLWPLGQISAKFESLSLLAFDSVTIAGVRSCDLRHTNAPLNRLTKYHSKMQAQYLCSLSIFIQLLIVMHGHTKTMLMMAPWIKHYKYGYSTAHSFLSCTNTSDSSVWESK
jgi:hypothetical protein